MGPERKFINKVHNQLDPEWRTFVQCNTGIIGGNGTPDYYYEVLGTATWIEYKVTYTKKLPKVIDLNDQKKRYALSPFQRRWLNRAYDNKVRVAVALGSEDGEVLLFTKRAWEFKINVEDTRQRRGIASPAGVAQFAAGFECRGVIVQHNEDARIQHEHTSASLHHWFPAPKDKG